MVRKVTLSLFCQIKLNLTQYPHFPTEIRNSLLSYFEEHFPFLESHNKLENLVMLKIWEKELYSAMPQAVAQVLFSEPCDQRWAALSSLANPSHWTKAVVLCILSHSDVNAMCEKVYDIFKVFPQWQKNT